MRWNVVFFGPGMLGGIGLVSVVASIVFSTDIERHRFLMMLASGFVGNDEEFINLQAF